MWKLLWRNLVSQVGSIKKPKKKKDKFHHSHKGGQRAMAKRGGWCQNSKDGFSVRLIEEKMR